MKRSSSSTKDINEKLNKVYGKIYKNSEDNVYFYKYESIIGIWLFCHALWPS